MSQGKSLTGFYYKTRMSLSIHHNHFGLLARDLLDPEMRQKLLNIGHLCRLRAYLITHGNGFAILMNETPIFVPVARFKQMQRCAFASAGSASQPY